MLNRREVEQWKNIRNRNVEKLNRAITDVLAYSDGELWSSGRQIASGLLDEVITGFRSSPLTLKHNLQILLNLYCNDNMNYNDGTCCSSSETYTMLQVVTYALLGLWYVIRKLVRKKQNNINFFLHFQHRLLSCDYRPQMVSTHPRHTHLHPTKPKKPRHRGVRGD